MRKILYVPVFLLFTLVVAHADEQSSVSFGMPVEISYHITQEDLNIWNFRGNLGLDLMFRLHDFFWLGVEGGIAFGVHKAHVQDPDFDRINVDFPIRITGTFFLTAVNLQIYGGLIYVGEAFLENGTLQMDDFSFHMSGEIGGRIGFGDITFFFVDIGLVFGDSGYFRLGIGLRVGLF